MNKISISDDLKSRMAIDALSAAAGGGLGYLQGYLTGKPSPLWNALMGALVGAGASEATQFALNSPRKGPYSLANRLATSQYESLRGIKPFDDFR